MNCVFNFNPFGFQLVGHFTYRVLCLRHCHAVTRHDDDLRRIAHDERRVRCRTRLGLTVGVAAGPWSGGAVTAEATQKYVDDRAVHAFAHDVAEDRAGRADQSADHNQQVVAEAEANRRRRPTGVAVEERDHDGHVCAADAHDQVIADEEGCDRHDRQRNNAACAEVPDKADQRDDRRCCVQEMTAGQFLCS